MGHPSRFLLLAFVLTATLPSGAPPARAEVVERIVAVVNNRIILLSELRQRVREYLPQLSRIRDPKQRMQQYKRVQRAELEKLVDAILIEERLLRQAARYF